MGIPSHRLPDFSTDKGYAERLDASDRLAGFRDRFFLPEGKVYLLGNSLGLLSRSAAGSLERIVGEWRRLALDAWTDAPAPWLNMAERLGASLAPLVGAQPDEVVATGATTVNLHALVSTFYEPRAPRTKLLADNLTFPSDVHALASQVRLRNLDPSVHLVFAPVTGGRYIDEDATIEMMTDEVALIVLPSVLFRSGQLLDVGRLTEAARARGIPIGFDCSHSVGVIPHELDRCGVDFAFWCSYKYLNGGPGSPGFLYVNRRHFDRRPALAGWFGFVKSRQFDMLTEFDHQRSAGGWQISSPGILGLATIEGALADITEAGIDSIREKSLRMTSYLMRLIDETAAENQLIVGTPREAHRRGGHVAVEHPHAEALHKALVDRRVMTDLRPPNVIRICPSPLYNTYQELWQVAHHLKDILTELPRA